MYAADCHERENSNRTTKKVWGRDKDQISLSPSHLYLMPNSTTHNKCKYHKWRSINRMGTEGAGTSKSNHKERRDDEQYPNSFLANKPGLAADELKVSSTPIILAPQWHHHWSVRCRTLLKQTSSSSSHTHTHSKIGKVLSNSLSFLRALLWCKHYTAWLYSTISFRFPNNYIT